MRKTRSVYNFHRNITTLDIVIMILYLLCIAQPQSSGNTDITNFGSLIIAVLAALLLALIVYAIIMSVWVFISRKQKKQSTQTTE